MSRGVNRVTLLGHLGQDPESRSIPSGATVANFSLATSEQWKDKQTGQKMEKTEWHRITMYGRLAEIAAEYLRKGAQVYIEGRLQTRKWTDKQGVERYTTEIIAHELQMLGGKSGGGQQQQRQAAPATAATAATEVADPGFDDDLDIPF